MIIASERGVVLKYGFSARQLFRSMLVKTKLHRDMLAAVTKLRRNGMCASLSQSKLPDYAHIIIQASKLVHSLTTGLMTL